MRKWFLPVMLLLLAPARPALADVQITLHDGLVSLTAHDATVKQILTEWARVGQSTIVNIERLTGAPLTLQMTDVPEQQALQILLRSISGYLAAPRAAQVANASRFDRIIVMPTAAQARPAGAIPPAPVPAPRQAEDAGDDPSRGVSPAMPANMPPPMPMPTGQAQGGQPAPRAPIFNAFPTPDSMQPQPNGQQQPAADRKSVV